MKTRFLIALCLSGVLLNTTWAAAEQTFAKPSDLSAITREDQTKALKIKAIRSEVTLADAIQVLTTYRRVSKKEYMKLAHQIPAKGTVTLTDGKQYKWEIEPDYAAKVINPDGAVTYLLRPQKRTANQ